ncbi:MAG: DUF2029 domain-containing protein [Rhodocyclaceae bacterium]|nr:DUF2029 domain-containing protein [Rhodocyclaceae bacterium]
MRAARLAMPLLWLVVAGYCAYIGWAYVDGQRAAADGERPLYTDFVSTYAGSLLMRSAPPENVYRPRRMYEAEQAAARAVYDVPLSESQVRAVGFSPWMYPPTFLLMVVPLAYLPYLVALIAWTAVTALPYLDAMRGILRSRFALPAALAAPPVFFNAMYGQTGFLIGGLIALGLLHLRSLPLMAGMLIGLASVKPHFGLLIPLALAAGGHWRAFGAAAGTVIGLIVLSVLAFGDDPWFGFIGTVGFHMDGIGAGVYNWPVMTTVLSLLKLIGAPMAAAWAAQGAVSLAVALAVVGLWWRLRREPARDGLLYALLCTGTTLALPFAYAYDLVLLVPARPGCGLIWTPAGDGGGSGPGCWWPCWRCCRCACCRRLPASGWRWLARLSCSA